MTPNHTSSPLDTSADLITPAPGPGAGVPSYQDLVPEYKDYVHFQTQKWSSHEITVPKWEEGQRRYVNATFLNIPRQLRIADVACGDGVGLRYFRELNFANVTGVELNPEKLEMALKSGYPVMGRDMHDLSCFEDQSLDIVYSSHSLEHAYRPATVLSEFHRVLVPEGTLFMVLPYPDPGNWNDEAHGAKYELGTNIEDQGASVIRYFEKNGFQVTHTSFDHFREPEIWLQFKKI